MPVAAPCKGHILLRTNVPHCSGTRPGPDHKQRADASTAMRVGGGATDPGLRGRQPQRRKVRKRGGGMTCPLCGPTRRRRRPPRLQPPGSGGAPTGWPQSRGKGGGGNGGSGATAAVPGVALPAAAAATRVGHTHPTAVAARAGGGGERRTAPHRPRPWRKGRPRRSGGMQRG